MGVEFGNVYKGLRGVVTYTLSPFEQRAFAGTSRLPAKHFRSMKGNFPTWAIPFTLYYILYKWTVAEQARRDRKNPADYINDE